MMQRSRALRALHARLLLASTAQGCSLTTAAAAAAAEEGGAAAAAQQHKQQQPYKTPIYAACVLERLPIVKSPPPAWEAGYKAWVQVQLSAEGLLKQYPQLDAKQREASNKGAPAFNPTTTPADASGDVSTMKRRLADKLVLLVRAQHNALSAAAAAGGASSSSSSKGWTFPHASYQAGETIRQTAERALRQAIGQSQVYFVGNAPMAHLNILQADSSSSSSSSSTAPAPDDEATTSSDAQQQQQEQQRQQPHQVVVGRVFFHLAQVVNDPWDVELAGGGGAASDVAWVAKAELPQFIQDEQLLALAHKML